MAIVKPTKADALLIDASSPLADPADRLAAHVLDMFVPTLPAVVALPIGILIGSANTIRVGFLCTFLAAFSLTCLNVVWLHRYGQTLGKRLVGIRIVRTDGTRARLLRLLGLRIFIVWLLGAIPVLGTLFAAIDALFVFQRDRRCLHDRFADTIVIDVGRAPRDTV